MKQFFEGLTEETAIKTRYKELAKENHPDLGGCVEAMKVINQQYEQILSGLYQRAGKSITEIEELLAKSQHVAEKLCEIIACPCVMVELCGDWLWVTGDTRPVKDKLREAGFFWAPKKQAWYWREESNKSRNRGKFISLEEIKGKYGTTAVTSIRGRERIA